MTPEKSNLLNKVSITLILLISVIVRLWRIDWGLPGVFEEAFPLSVAWGFWDWGHSGLSFNPHFFNYPALTFYIQYLAQAIQYFGGHIFSVYADLNAFKDAFTADPTSFFIIGRFITTSFDIATIFIVYLFGKKFIHPWVGLIGSLIISLNPVHVVHAQLVNVDILLTFFIVFTLYFTSQLLKTPTNRLYLIIGLFIGLATSTKYTGALLVLPLVITHFARNYTVSTYTGSSFSGPLIKSLLLSMGVFILLNPYIMIDYQSFLNSFSYEQMHMAAGHLGIIPTESTTVFYFSDALPSSFGLVFLLFAGLGIISLFNRKLLPFIPILSFTIVYAFVLLSWNMRADRYLLPILPVIALLGSMGLWFVVEKIMMRVNIRWGEPILVLAFVVLSLVIPFSKTLAYHRTHELDDTRTVAAKWITESIPVNSAIAMTPLGIHISGEKYLLINIPFHPVYLDIIEPFYRTDLYSDVDVFVVSSFDYGRFLTDPVKYESIIHFYNQITSTWTLRKHITPADNQSGPEISFYVPPLDEEDSVDSNELLEILNIGNEDWSTDFLLRLGTQAYVKDKFNRSSDMLSVVHQLRPDNMACNITYAQALYQVDRFDEARNIAVDILRQDPTNTDILGLHAYILLQMDSLSEARKEFQEILVRDSTNQPAIIGLRFLEDVASQNDQQK